MGLPVGIFLTAVGAVLAFAVHATVSGLDVRAVGWILMIVGIAGILLDLVMFAPRRRRHVLLDPRLDLPMIDDLRRCVVEDDLLAVHTGMEQAE